MPRRRLTLADYYVPGIKGLIGLSEAQVKELTAALQAEQPIYYHPRQLAAHLESRTAIDPPVLAAIIRALAGLHSARVITGLPVSDFAELAFQAIEEKGLKPSDPQASMSFKANLLELLKLEGSLAVASKAQSVVTEQDRIFSQA